MISFRLGSFKMHGGGTGVLLPAESSQTALDKLNELALLAPAIELPRAKAVEITKSAEPPASETIERFYSDGSSVERWKFWASSLPLSLILGDGFYLYFTGSPESVAGAVMLAGFVIFCLIGLLIEMRGLGAFVCPGCQAPIGEWDTNEKHRILFNCVRCESKWDIEYKPRPFQAKSVIPSRRSYCSILCSCRGAHKRGKWSSVFTLFPFIVNASVPQEVINGSPITPAVNK